MKKRIMEKFIKVSMINKILIVGVLATIVTGSAVTGVYYFNKNKNDVKKQTIATSVKQKEDEVKKKEEEKAKEKFEDEAKKVVEEEAKKKDEDEAIKKEAEEIKKKTYEEVKKTEEQTKELFTKSSSPSYNESIKGQTPSGNSNQESSPTTSTQTQNNQLVQEGINQELTNIVNSRNSFNNLGMTTYVSMFNDLARSVATGNLSTSSAEAQVKALQPWEDNCKEVPSGRALYTIQGCSVKVFITSSQDGLKIVREQISKQCKAAGAYGYNIVYTNLDGTNKVVSIGVGCSFSPR